MTFSEQPVCSGGTPIVGDATCPPAASVPALRDLSLTLTMGTTTYNGKLRTDYEDRLNRLNTLVTSLYKAFYAFQGGANFRVQETVEFDNPFEEAGRTANQVIDARGFAGLMAYLKALDKKMSYLSKDLLRIEAVSSIVEHWQLKPESRRPVACFLFGELDRATRTIGPPKWQISVPHAEESMLLGWNNSFGYRQGKYMGIATLKDNSKIIMFADLENSADTILNSLIARLPPAYQEGVYLKLGQYNGPPIPEREIRLRRIDYYAGGQIRAKPTNFARFSRVSEEGL